MGIYLSMPVLSAFVISTLCVLLCVSYMLRSIRMELAVVSPYRAIDSFCKSRTAGLNIAFIVLLAGAIAAYLLKLGSLYAYLRPAAICCGAGILFLFWIFRACSKSFTGYKALKSAKLYGGKEA